MQGLRGCPSSSAEPGAQGSAANTPKGSILVSGQKIQGEGCWHDQRKPQKSKSCHERGNTNISRDKGGCLQNVGRALPCRTVLIHKSRSLTLGPAVQGSSLNDAGCARYMYHQNSPPSRPRLPTPVLQIAGEGCAPQAGQSSQHSETTVSHPRASRLPLPLSWGAGCLKQLCELEKASERGRCPCAGAVTSMGDRCTVIRALGGRCGLKFFGFRG